MRLDAAPDDPASFGSVGSFALTDHTGSTVTAEDLRGRVWILGAVFTTCSTVCPRMSSTMSGLQERLAGTDATLVSVSVDPVHDTPQVLAEYAREYEAEDGRWTFLTGTTEAVDALVRDTFHLPLARLEGDDVPPGLRVTHDARLAVVDTDGDIRGYYDSRDPAAVAKLLERVRFLEGDER